MRGLDIAIESLKMHGVDASCISDAKILDEARRLMGVKFFENGDGGPKFMFGPYKDLDEFERLSRFLVADFEEGYSRVAKFKEGDLIEADGMPWKYGVVRRITTTWNSTAEPR